ncbi:MAG: hypothetical protein IGS39_11155 [Calothrix sp. C42_A2020_038]|nr:hypothetical protein [Calothrix sp. C42_A2020_038]
MTTNQYSPLLRLVAKFMKYFLLLAVGVAIAYTLSMILGVSHLGLTLLSLSFGWFWRLGVALLCLIGVAMVYESLR